MKGSRWLVSLCLGALLSSACFSPQPSQGAPCSVNDTCPSGLLCIQGFCVTSGGSNSDSGTDGSGSGGECSGQPDGTPCGSAPVSDCAARESCVAEACVSLPVSDGTACYDCAAGAPKCAACAQGACEDTSCQPTTTTQQGALTSALVGGNADEGNMFDVVAAQTITITSFESHLNTTGSTDYEIWSRPGTYVGNEDSSTGWTQVGTATFNGAGSGAYSAIPIAVNVTITAGQRRAFYLTNRTANNRYHNGSAVGATLASTPELTVYEGAGVNFGTNGFGGINTPRAWEGKIHYVRTISPALATPMMGTTTGDGVMFSATPTKNLHVNRFAVHLAAGTHDVAVYFRRGTFAGSETTAGDWQLLASAPGVTSAGASMPTSLPVALDMVIESGKPTAFYVTSSGAIRSQGVTGTNAASNADLVIGQGVTVTGMFGGAGAASTPNVELGYDPCL